MHQSYFIRGNTIDGGDVQPHNMEISDKSITIGWIREKATENEFQLTGHAHKERQEEVIKTKEIRDALMQGELLENYPDDPRGPSCLVLGYSEGRAIHIVCGRTRVD